MIRIPPQRGGWLEVICGPMFSGKSEEMIRRLRRGETVIVGAEEQYEAGAATATSRDSTSPSPPRRGDIHVALPA